MNTTTAKHAGIRTTKYQPADANHRHPWFAQVILCTCKNETAPADTYPEAIDLHHAHRAEHGLTADTAVVVD